MKDREYKKVGNTFFHLETSDELARIIDGLINDHREIRVRIFLGDRATGREWGEEHDVAGYMGRSTGTRKIPLMINNRRSLGGPGLLDHCILKLQTTAGRVLWQAENYQPSTYEAKEIEPCNFGNGKVYRAEGWKDGEMLIARFQTIGQAKRWAAFMRGERGSK